jgi:hypothetical protein
MDSSDAGAARSRSLVDMRRQLRTWRSTRGYCQAIPPRERVKELAELYGIAKLFSTAG